MADLATLTLAHSTINWRQIKNDYQLICDGTAQAISNFEAFDQQAEELGEFKLSNLVKDQRQFVTAGRKISFMARKKYLFTSKKSVY